MQKTHMKILNAYRNQQNRLSKMENKKSVTKIKGDSQITPKDESFSKNNVSLHNKISLGMENQLYDKNYSSNNKKAKPATYILMI
mmetsp:Transcript_41798/g.40157  ORF Transcript_41798/g.40157 Transcript_41798/m.40157 type:complete len:85 (+) Transcript_41798:360-614(+)